MKSLPNLCGDPQSEKEPNPPEELIDWMPEDLSESEMEDMQRWREDVYRILGVPKNIT